MVFAKALVTSLLFFALSPTAAAGKCYLAYSLEGARQQFLLTGSIEATTRQLGGITRVLGLIRDETTGDVILVGSADRTAAPLSLDDFVVALRARFGFGAWPVVSIDPVKRDGIWVGQHVRYEGGIRGTDFGHTLYEADLALKKISIGFLDSGVRGFENYWDLSLSERHPGRLQVSARFWFYPSHPRVYVSANVALINDLRVEVFTEVMSATRNGRDEDELSRYVNIPGEEFAKQVNVNFEEVARHHEPISRLKGLNELVALTRALEEMETIPWLSFWLNSYPLRSDETIDSLDVIERTHETGFHMMGGVELTALTMKVVGSAADAIAVDARHGETLVKAVITAREEQQEKAEPLVIWDVCTENDAVYTTDDPRFDEATTLSLFPHAEFLRRHKHYRDAIELYTEIIDAVPERVIVEAYVGRSLAYACIDEYGKANADIDTALRSESENPIVHYVKGLLYLDNERYDDALLEFDAALELNPMFCPAFSGRVAVFEKEDKIRKAMKEKSQFIGCESDR